MKRFSEIFSAVFFLLAVTSQGALASGPYLDYPTVIDIQKSEGSTYFSLMTKKIKPALDQYAADGFQVADGDAAVSALARVDGAVASKVLRGIGSKEKLKSFADALSKKGPMTFLQIQNEISKARVSRDKYGLAAYLALVSGGGVAVKINDTNYAYNVNYGSGDEDGDEMTGRSFGESQPGHKAGDASDKAYLKALESYVRGDVDGASDFYRAILEILTDNDPSGFSKISKIGQASAADFLAVFTAEEDRHLMADLKSHAWDEALLEVTLLSAFHAGQKVVQVMFNGELTATTLKQAPGGEPRTQKQKASMVDYWQFSESSDPQYKNRSGINITRKQFRALGAKISDYERANHPALVKKVEAHFDGVKTGGNLFAELSAFLINARTPSRLNDPDLADDFTEFLGQVTADADQITDAVLANTI